MVNIGATPRTFEFDVLGNGVAAGRIAVPVPATEVQRLSFTGSADHGTFTLSFGALAPTTTVGLAVERHAAYVQAALEAWATSRRAKSA